MGPIRRSETSLKITNLLCVTLQRSEDMIYTAWKPEISQVLPEYCRRYSDWATDWTDRGSNLGKSKRFSLLRNFQTVSWPTRPPVSIPLLPGLNWPVCDVELSTPSSTEVKNDCSFTCALPVYLCVADMNSFTCACAALLSANGLVE
jgi:hypothetical protein